jgi:hypothetical protein
MNRRFTIEHKFEAVLAAAYSLTPEFFWPAGSPVDAEAAIRSAAELTMSELSIECGLKVSPVFTTFVS